MVEVLYGTGIRVAELVNLEWKDLDAAAGTVFVREGKGGKDRIAPIGRKAIQKLTAWRQWLDPGFDDPIFPGFLKHSDTRARKVRARGLSTHAVENIVAARAQRAGITQRVTPHTLRHCFVTHLLERGADSPSIQKMVGHQSLAITQGYAHISPAFLLAQAKLGGGWSRSVA